MWLLPHTLALVLKSSGDVNIHLALVRVGKPRSRGLDTAVYFRGKSISLFLTSHPQGELCHGISFATTIKVAPGPSAREGLGQQ